MNYRINKEEENFIIEQLENLLKECKNLQKKLTENSYTARERFEFLKEKRRRLEAVGNKFRAEGLKFDSFYEKDVARIMKILVKELMKLVHPRKRNGAQ